MAAENSRGTAWRSGRSTRYILDLFIKSATLVAGNRITEKVRLIGDDIADESTSRKTTTTHSPDASFQSRDAALWRSFSAVSVALICGGVWSVFFSSIGTSIPWGSSI